MSPGSRVSEFSRKSGKPPGKHQARDFRIGADGGPIVILREPFVATLFQRGQVNQEGLALTASVVAVYALSLFLVGHWRVLQNFFYADATPRS